MDTEQDKHWTKNEDDNDKTNHSNDNDNNQLDPNSHVAHQRITTNGHTLNGSLVNGTNSMTYDSIPSDKVRQRASCSSNVNDELDGLLFAKAPKDRYYMIQWAFFLLGLTTLLPWNFFITATDFFFYKFRDVTKTYDQTGPVSAERTTLQVYFESSLAIASNVPMLLSMLLNAFYGQRFRLDLRIYTSLGVMLSTFAITTIFVVIDTDHMQTTYFVIIMALVVITNIFSAIFQAAIFGLVSQFPDANMHTMVTGQACAGLFAVLLQILSMINNTGPVHSALWYFLVSTFVLAAAIICYWLMDNEYTRYYLADITSKYDVRSRMAVPLVNELNEAVFFDTYKRVWPLAISTMLSFWVSLSVYPGVVTLNIPEHPNISPTTGRFFIPLTTFLTFNCGDLAGRTMSWLLPFPAHRQKSLLVLAILRVVILPVLLLGNIQPRNHLPVCFNNDFVFVFAIAALSVTSGYVFSSSMVMAANNSRKEHLELTGFILALSLACGLSLGSLCSTITLTLI